MQATLTTPKNTRTFKTRHAVIILLSVIAVAAVFWWLKLTGITMAGEAFCGMDEHTHTEQCLAEGCQIPEHTHTASCYSNPNADLESEADWKSTFKNVELSGVLPNDVINVAKTQVGYHESELNYEVDADGQRHGYTRYGQWYGNTHGDWSAMFVSFTLHYAGIPESVAPYSAGAETMRLNWETAGMYTSASGYSPREGDIVFFDKDKNGSADAVGFLYMNSGEQLMSIEGDLNDEVGMAYYSYDDSKILGYGILNEVIRKTAKADDVEYARLLNELMVELPDYEEVELQLLLLENDESAYEAYFMEVSEQVKHVFMYWEDIPDNVKPLITNSDKFFKLSSFLTSENIIGVSAKAEYEIPQVNDYEFDLQPTIIYSKYGGTAEKFLQDNASNAINKQYRFSEWTIYEVTLRKGDDIFVEDEIGDDDEDVTYSTTDMLYVSKIYDESSSIEKNKIVAPNQSDDSNKLGFLLYVYKPAAEINVGDSVIPSSSYLSSKATVVNPYDTSLGGYNFYVYAATYETTREPNDAGHTGLGKVAIGTYAKLSNTNTSNDLNTIITADTSSLININLYDYTYNINTKANATKTSEYPYPGFQRPDVVKTAGLYNTTTKKFTNYNFGDIVVTGFNTEEFRYTKNANGLNLLESGTVNGHSLAANVPILGKMYYKSIDGYPALLNQTSLSYLFGGENVSYVKKMNDNNISGLFTFNAQTNTYSFDSRKNHAQFDAETDTFVLYKEKITPNFIMYPFGNFMPLNNINTQTTKFEACNHNYFRRTAASAMSLYNATGLEKYLNLAEVMENVVNNYGGNFGAKDILTRYDNEVWTESNLVSQLEQTDNLTNLYNIDYDEESNFFFGMDISFDFQQPEDGIVNGDDMVFEFVGDDDVWVYIDDVLVLNLSGIHRHVGGKINFATGEVYVYAYKDFTGEVYNDKDYYQTINNEKVGYYKKWTFAELGLTSSGTLSDYTKHNLKFYYMERGSGSSICSINFNIPLVPQNSIVIEKEIDNKTNADLGDQEYAFIVLESTPTNGTYNKYFDSPITYEVRDLVTNEKLRDVTTNNDTIIYLKAGEKAIINGLEVTEETLKKKYIVRELFDPKYVQQFDSTSATVDIKHSLGTLTRIENQYINFLDKNYSFVTITGSSSGDYGGFTVEETHTFKFVNHLSANRTNLDITKNQVEFDSTEQMKDFTFELTFDGVPILVGTEYILLDSNGNETTTKYTVQTEGKITVKGGTTVRIKNILGGTVVSVKEVFGNGINAGDYVVEFPDTLENATDTVTTSNSITFTANYNSTIKLNVKNTRAGYQFQINGNKNLLNPDGEEHTYKFILQEGTYADGVFTPNSKAPIVETVNFGTTDINKPVTFNVALPKNEYTSGVTYYMQIAEEGAGIVNGVDETFYIVKVTIEGEAVTTELLKNGTESVSENEFTFTNTNVRDLTIQKVVEGVTTNSKFDFEIEALFQGEKLNGTFTCEGLDGTTQITFANGKSSFQLAHNEQVKILGLPYGAEITVKESAAGYYTKFALDGAEATVGTSVNFELKQASTLVVTNVGGTELPATGTPLRKVLPIVGCGIMLLALGGAFVFRFRRNKPSTEK